MNLVTSAETEYSTGSAEKHKDVASQAEEQTNGKTDFEDSDSSLPDSEKNEISSIENEIQNNMKKNASQVIDDKDIINVLLIGSDTRKEGGSGRSDVMMLISINKDTKKIIVTSFLRDIYLQIPGKRNNRINAAYAFGGADLLLDTIRQNFKIQVDQYASIDFYSFMDVVDAVGGVTIEVTEKEVPVTNGYIRDLNRLTGKPEDRDCLAKAGTYLMNGKQALAYSRNRYVGNGDFSRTERQRKVIEQIYKKIKKLNLLEVKDLLDIILPKVTTNLSENDLFSLILSLPSIMQYDVEQWAVPTSDSYKPMRINGMAVLGIDFQENINELYHRIYNKDSE
jgi:LCP family protein required for cell wall assembly